MRYLASIACLLALALTLAGCAGGEGVLLTSITYEVTADNLPMQVTYQDGDVERSWASAVSPWSTTMDMHPGDQAIVRVAQPTAGNWTLRILSGGQVLESSSGSGDGGLLETTVP